MNLKWIKLIRFKTLVSILVFLNIILKCSSHETNDNSNQPTITIDSNGYIEKENGIEGSILLKVTLDNQVSEVNLPAVGSQMISKICRLMGYKDGSKKDAKKFNRQEMIFSVKDKNCRNLLPKIILNKELTSKEIRSVQGCFQKNNKNFLAISCKNRITISTDLAYHSTGDGVNFCPIGFSKRSSDAAEDYPKKAFCLPNRCSCDNGIAAISTYEFMSSICGVSLGNEFVTEETDGTRSERLNIGQETTQDKWPFQVMLFKDVTSDEPHCSSVILSPTFLLTVGHCLTLDSDSIVVNLNTLPEVYALANSNIKGKIPSRELILHPNYFNHITGTIDNDLGIVYLSEAIFFNQEYRPICIHDSSMSDMSSNDTEHLTVVGHGGSTILKEADFIILDNTFCEDILKVEDHYKNSEDIPSMANKICGASVSDSKTGTCKGDSGSPLMLKTQDLVLEKLVEKYTLLGLVSLGSNKCVKEPSPTVFIEIYKYQSWIDSTIKDIEKSYSGRYCVGDETKQCASCDVSYKLEGVNCAQEFTQNQMSSLYDFFEDSFCANNCFDYMKIKPINDTIESGSWDITNLNEIFTAEYKKCKCLNGEPSLRCSNETAEYCDPDGCDENFIYDIKSHSCIPASVAATCTKFEHYVKLSNRCEPNVCYCNLGEPSLNCFEHNLHICKPSSCISGTEPIEVAGGSECVKKCSKILEMDSSWYQPVTDLQVYWQIMKSDDPHCAEIAHFVLY